MIMAGLDPLFLGDASDLTVVAIVLIKVVVAFVALMVSVMLMVWWERKFISDMQNRIGPNRAGPFGILQTFADGIKLFFKEDLIPDEADRFVFKLAPYLSLVPAFLVFTVIPIAGISAAMAMAPSPGSVNARLSRSPIHMWASCSCWPCRPSVSTASCSRVGRRAPSIRCWGRSEPLLRW